MFSNTRAFVSSSCSASPHWWQTPRSPALQAWSPSYVQPCPTEWTCSSQSPTWCVPAPFFHTMRRLP